MLNTVCKFLLCGVVFAYSATCAAEQSKIDFEAQDASIADVSGVSSVRHALEFNCEVSTLNISMSASRDAVEGRKGVISAKLSVPSSTYDLSKQFTRALSRTDILDRGMTVQCSPSSGAFVITFSDAAKVSMTGSTTTTLTVFPDGVVEGSRGELSGG